MHLQVAIIEGNFFKYASRLYESHDKIFANEGKPIFIENEVNRFNKLLMDKDEEIMQIKENIEWKEVDICRHQQQIKEIR